MLAIIIFPLLTVEMMFARKELSKARWRRISSLAADADFLEMSDSFLLVACGILRMKDKVHH